MSQKRDILNHLQLCGPITPLDALQHYGCFRLAAVIFDLRQEGHEITTTMVKRNDKEFAEYKLTEHQLELI